MEVLSSISAFLVAPVAIYWLQEWKNYPQRVRHHMEQELKAYTGGCHCNSVRFTLLAPRHLVVWNCNCSICFMKRNWHFIIPASQFSLVESSKDYLTEYRFNTKTAKHLFCKICGVQAYYVPRSNPDGIAVTLACIPVEQVESFELRNFDGQNWESFYACTNISHFSNQGDNQPASNSITTINNNAGDPANTATAISNDNNNNAVEDSKPRSMSSVMKDHDNNVEDATAT